MDSGRCSPDGEVFLDRIFSLTSVGVVSEIVDIGSLKTTLVGDAGALMAV